jgi:phenylalanyl-tRNA synthetase beta chain
MKVSYNWLKKFVNFELSPQELASMLTSIGIDTLVISNKYNWNNVITVKVLDIRKHCNADRLFICKVSDGLNEYSVVCGATNIAVGQIVPLAKIGSILSGSFKIKKSRIRGIESEGIICSEKELGLKSDSEGILILNKNTKIGVALESILYGVDSILEIEIATNRGDCLSYLGIAREIGAKLHIATFMPTIETPITQKLNCVEVKSTLCSRYICGIISGIKVATSPKWLADILWKGGIRSVNNIVDITNYVMIELGQPLHTFDMAKLSSKKIIVREAVDFENIITLDGKERMLNSGMLVVADDQKPITIAGIMGGKCSSINDTTETIFLESAIFDTVSIRKTSKKLNLISDSSYRFERGLGWDITELAFWRAVNLIADIAGGKIEKKEDLQITKHERINISLRVERVNKVLGYIIEENKIIEILKFLGITLKLKNRVIFCTVPSWRNDIKIEIDLIEEIARIKGYDTIPSYEQRTCRMYISNNSFLSVIVKEFRIKLKGFGFNEVLNYSFLEIDELKKFDLKHYYKIANPISKEYAVLRPSLLPGLYKNLLLNIAQGSDSVTLFEHGKIFNEYGEKKTFAIIMYGRVWKEWWKWSEQKINPKFDFYFGGGIIKNILQSDEFTIDENLNPERYYHFGKTAAVIYRKKIIGQFGILKPSISDNIKDDVFYFQLDLDQVENTYIKKKPIYKAYSKFPMIKRDISIIVDRYLQFTKIEKVIKDIMNFGGILKKYSLFSVYTDESKIGNDKISYSFRLYYKNDKRTLTDEEVNKDIGGLLNRLDKKLNIKLR